MFTPKKKMILSVLFAFFICSSSGLALAQEGVLHRLLRSVIAIPEAVLHSLHGPQEGENSGNKAPIIHYPYPVQANYGQTYGYAVPPDVLIHNSPGYVTYNVIEKRSDCQQPEQADTHVFSPIPFDNR